MTHHLWILAIALICDRLIGDPDWLWEKTGHPAAWMGWLVETADKRFNNPKGAPEKQLRNGGAVFAGLMGAALVSAWIIAMIAGYLGPLGWLIETFVVLSLLAQKSLRDHVEAVERTLADENLCAARRAISRIVGRSPETLDRSGIARAGIESLAENFSDGVVAPAFWYAFFGMPGIIVYKTINTADSMIGHRSERYLEFGRVSAQADDLANWLPARLSAILIAFGAFLGGNPRAGRDSLSTALRDSGLHSSPNAGWPEAAIAGACGIALGGPRQYDGQTVWQGWINAAGESRLGSSAVRTAIGLFDLSCQALLAGVIVLATLTLPF